MKRDIDAEYDELMDQLDAAACELNADERGKQLQALRRRIKTMLREQMRLAAPSVAVDQRTGGSMLIH